MLDLVSDCGIFLAIKNGEDNYYQLSGKADFTPSKGRRPENLKSRHTTVRPTDTPAICI